MYCDLGLEVNDTGEIKTMVEVCRKYNVTKVPSFWVYDIVGINETLEDKGFLMVGFQNLKQLKEVSGC